MARFKYSIVIPVYNSAETLLEVFRRIKNVFENTGEKFQIILVEDAGKDNSWEVIDGLKEKHPDLIVAKRLSQNKGQHFATVSGFELCEGEFIFTIDDDLQIPPEEVTKLLQKQLETGADLVYGTYSVKRRDPFVNICRAIAVSLLKAIYRLDHFGSSFRLIKKELVQEVLLLNSRNAVLDSILVFKARKIAHQKVNRFEENSTSGYSVLGLIRLAIKLFTSFIYLSAIVKKRPPRISLSKSIAK